MKKETELKVKKVLIPIVFGLAILFGILICTNKDNIPESQKKREQVFSESHKTIKYYLNDNLNNPYSYESVSWSEPKVLDNNTYLIQHSFRAKNGFNAIVLQTWSFYLDSIGRITSAQQLKE